MQLHLPTRMQAHIDAGKRVMSLLSDAGFYIVREREGEHAEGHAANDIADGRSKLNQLENEMAVLNFAAQLLRTLQLGREKKWKEAYDEIAAAGEFARGKSDLLESWSLVRYQLDAMRVEADPPAAD